MTQLVLKELEKQAKEGRIDEESIFCDEDEHVITFEYSDGTLGLDIVCGFEDGLDGAYDYSDTIHYDMDFPAMETEKTADAIILNTRGDEEGVNERCEELATKWSNSGINTRLDDSVTLDDLTELNDYEFIYFKTHGIYGYYKLFKNNTSCVILNQKKSEEVYNKYKDDRKKGRVGVSGEGYYFITPDFFRVHYDSGVLKNSIMFFGCCQLLGAGDSKECKDMETVLNALSVPAFVGIYNENYTFFNLDFVDVFMDNLILGKTTRESFDEAVSIWGNNDSDWYYLKYEKSDPHEYDGEYKNTGYIYLRGKGCENATLTWEGEDIIPDSKDASEITPVEIKILSKDEAVLAFRNYMIKEIIPKYYDSFDDNLRWDDLEKTDEYCTFSWERDGNICVEYTMDLTSGMTTSIEYAGTQLSRGIASEGEYDFNAWDYLDDPIQPYENNDSLELVPYININIFDAVDEIGDLKGAGYTDMAIGFKNDYIEIDASAYDSNKYIHQIIINDADCSYSVYGIRPGMSREMTIQYLAMAGAHDIYSGNRIIANNKRIFLSMDDGNCAVLYFDDSDIVTEIIVLGNETASGLKDQDHW